MSGVVKREAGGPTVTVALTVNGKARRVRVAPLKRLLDVLREELALPGTKEGCGEGECGACSVLMDGKSVCSCLVPAVQAQGAKIVTVEGLSRGGKLSVLQQAFVEMGAAQCGICTPGMLITSAELLARVKGRVPGEDEVREALAGNLCRCTGYQRIVDAVREVARRQNGGASRSASKSRAHRVRPAASRAAAKPRARARRGTKRSGR
jgi:carbon-monoxide dehydrogenase small subunit